MKGWGATEWSFVATILIELAVILFYNKGTMIAQSKLQSYEKEIKAKEMKKKAKTMEKPKM